MIEVLLSFSYELHIFAYYNLTKPLKSLPRLYYLSDHPNFMFVRTSTDVYVVLIWNVDTKGAWKRTRYASRAFVCAGVARMSGSSQLPSYQSETIAKGTHSAP